MKKAAIIFSLMLMMLAPAFVFGQDMNRPKDMGNSDFDDFKNSSFDIYDESFKLKQNVDHINKEVTEYSGIINTVGIDKLKNHYKALTETHSAIQELSQNIGELDEQSADMVSNAKDVSPKMKSLTATKNTNNSVKALGVAKDNLNAVRSTVESDIKLIKDELSARGEPIE